MDTELREAAEHFIKNSKNEFFYWSRECNSPNTLGIELIEAFEAGAKWYAQQLINQLDED